MKKWRPILFNGWSIRGILKRWKTQTRRVINPQPLWEEDPGQSEDGTWCGRYRKASAGSHHNLAVEVYEARSPHGLPGDGLWVRETWGTWQRGDATPVRGQPYDPELIFRADDEDPDIPHDLLWEPFRWRPSIFMPRWASRTDLEVEKGRVQRIQQISYADIIREGFHDFLTDEQQTDAEHMGSARKAFANLWDSINAKPRPVKVKKVLAHYVAYPWDESHPICQLKEWRGKPLLVFPNSWVWVTDFKMVKPCD
jgi:hypothetical protein